MICALNNRINNIIVHQISFKFYSMRKDSDVRSCCFKNMICVSVGLLIIFTTAIFVAKDYFGLKVKTMIEDTSLLKE